MNKQDDVMVGLAHVPARRYSPAMKITTVGEWVGPASPRHCSNSSALAAAWRRRQVQLHPPAGLMVGPPLGIPNIPHMHRHTHTRSHPPAGNKASIELRGPVEVKPFAPRDVPLAVARGLQGALQAAASGAGTLLPNRQLDLHQQQQQREQEAADQEPLHLAPSSTEPSTGYLLRPSGAAAPSLGGEAGLPPRHPLPSPFVETKSSTPAAAGPPLGASSSASPPPGGLPTITSAGSLGQASLSATTLSGGAGGSGQCTPTAASSWVGKAKHLRRASMQDNSSFMETLSTEPGTMLVRVTSGMNTGGGTTPSARNLRRMCACRRS